MSIPTFDDVGRPAQTQGLRPEPGETWQARNGTAQLVLSRDDPATFLPALHIQDVETGRKSTVCLDGREAVFGWGSPLDLMARINKSNQTRLPRKRPPRANTETKRGHIRR